MKKKSSRIGIEALEHRIAPAGIVDADWIPLVLGSPMKLTAGQGISTLGDKQGSYLLYVEKGSAIVFTQDYNGNDLFDANEITGIAAGDGLRLISFVDIHGDIVTNLRETPVTILKNGQFVTENILTLSDSDSNPSNDPQGLRGDGRVVLSNQIEKIELRSLMLQDIVDQNEDGTVDLFDLGLRQPPKSTFSIYGTIYAGGGFGADDGGLIFNSTGTDTDGQFIAPVPANFRPSVDGIRVGTAVNGQYYSFGVSGEYQFGTYQIGDNLSGLIAPYIPKPGQVGGTINTVTAFDEVPFNIGFVLAGDGGDGAPGGNVINVAMISDDTGGYHIAAGNGGDGKNGGDGGAILNFSDLGSQTGLVVLAGGDGGNGTTGAGGNSGDNQFTTVNLKGNVHIQMGDGGNGFTRGGRGASLAAGIFTEPVDIDVRGWNGWGTTHLPDGSSGAYTPILGSTIALDFNADGLGDFVYSSGEVSQLVVMVSDPLAPGTFQTFLAPDGRPTQGIYLSGPRNAKGLVTGDVNADGHPDIIAGSRDDGGTGDIMVFLAKFEDVNNDGVLTADEDINQNGIDEFIGFHEARHSTVPILGANEFTINDITLGDFDGDGRPELAVGAGPFAVIMQSDLEVNPATGEHEYTGQFFYDYGTKTQKVDGVVFPANRKDPSVFAPGAVGGLVSGPAIVEATTLNRAGDTYDVLIVSNWAANDAATYDWSTPIRSVADAALPDGLVGFFGYGPVDLDRGPGVNLVPFSVYDFTTVDFDNDGDMDVAAVSLDDAHPGFMIGSAGTGFGGGAGASGGGNQAGNYFPLPTTALTFYTIRAANVDGDGIINDLVAGHENGAVVILWAPGPDSVGRLLIDPDAQPPGGPYLNDGVNGGGESNHGFADPWYIDTSVNFTNFGSSQTLFETVGFLIYADPSGTIVPFIENSLSITGGDGGSALVGKGGGGGSIGGASTVEQLLDPTTGVPLLDPITGLPIFQLNGAVQITPSVTANVLAGNGGDGFSSGGNGGTITGVAIYPDGNTFVLNHSLRAGNGGRGIFGTGGAGGSLISNEVFSGIEFIAGDGGVGRTGGVGGSVIGSGASYDGYNASIAVVAGSGGFGTDAGGNGGSITNFRARVPEPDFTVLDGDPLEPAPSAPNPLIPIIQYLYLEGGQGGGSVRGKGGNGGNIVDSSPVPGSELQGELYLMAGRGGDGRAGGDGGVIKNFEIFQSGEENRFIPKFFTFVAGDGGNATAGRGGKGGGLSNITASGRASETSVHSAILSIYEVYHAADRQLFNRVIAGAGGTSAGNEGGAGGSVNDTVLASPNGSIAVIGGAGGSGLRLGGVGGSVFNSRINMGAATITKALIASGAGGDATAFIVNAIDNTPNQPLNVFGGRVGRGGNGGDVVGVFQEGAIDSHLDIVAGDGGSTIHFGTALDKVKKPFVGKGGSIRSVDIDGDLGNRSASVPFKSYHDVLNAQAFGQFVRDTLVGQVVPGVVPPPNVLLDDGLGNVGVTVGSAGRNKVYILDPLNRPTLYQSIPAKNGVNGSLENILANHLVAAVAGSVDRIASIQVYKGVITTNPTGGDKNPRVVDMPGIGPIIIEDFSDQNGIPTTSHEPELEGLMGDGALVAKRFLNSKGQKIPPPPNGYLR